ncbi:MAG: hypothetical protein AAFV95_16980 [Bacteroidota bacterium]
MNEKRILFIGGSLNQTTIMYQIAQELPDFQCHFTPFYADGYIRWLADRQLLNNTILGGAAMAATKKFLAQHQLKVDYRGEKYDYDLVVVGTDTVTPQNLLTRKTILVQEGMIDPENWKYHMVRKLNLPRYIANTSTTGLSHCYEQFCVASTGFKELFVAKGIPADKISVTGIPNFDNARAYAQNDFPEKDYVLAATSCLRETFKYENRRKFILKALRIANGRKLIFKLHPNEDHQRAIREIKQLAPQSPIYTTGNIQHMIANCSALVTKYSSVLMVALGLNKPVYSDLPEELLQKMRPIQNNGKSAKLIASICRQYAGQSVENEPAVSLGI